MWRTKRKKVITEAKEKPQVVAMFTENNRFHDIIRFNEKYIIRYDVVENKAKSVRCGVHSLPVAIEHLKTKFPEIEEVKDSIINENMPPMPPQSHPGGKPPMAPPPGHMPARPVGFGYTMPMHIRPNDVLRVAMVNRKPKFKAKDKVEHDIHGVGTIRSVKTKSNGIIMQPTYKVKFKGNKKLVTCQEWELTRI